jgi:hypothetical protein
MKMGKVVGTVVSTINIPLLDQHRLLICDVQGLDGAAEGYTIGRPRRSEHPMYVPALRAVVFGDAVVGALAGLRFWSQSSGTGDDWYRDVFAPGLEPLAERPVEHVLVTHGPPVVGDGQRQLAICLAAPPVPMY